MNENERLDAFGADSTRKPDLRRWLDLLVQWNARIDLTAARGPDELHDLMLADAAVLATWIPEGVRVVDVGSGAGAPGLALAILRPDLKVTLVEPLKKRVAFLRTVIGSLDRRDVELVGDRVEGVAAARGGAWDVAISRATLAPAEWIPVGLSLAPSVWVLLAKDEPPVLAETRAVEDHAYAWPLTKASRRAVRYVSAT